MGQNVFLFAVKNNFEFDWFESTDSKYLIKICHFYYCHKLLWNFHGLPTIKKGLFPFIIVVKLLLVAAKSHHFLNITHRNIKN